MRAGHAVVKGRGRGAGRSGGRAGAEHGQRAPCPALPSHTQGAHPTGPHSPSLPLPCASRRAGQAGGQEGARGGPAGRLPTLMSESDSSVRTTSSDFIAVASLMSCIAAKHGTAQRSTAQHERMHRGAAGRSAAAQREVHGGGSGGAPRAHATRALPAPPKRLSLPPQARSLQCTPAPGRPSL